MPEKLIYPFKHHTKLKEAFFKDLQNCEKDRSAVKDMYIYYRMGLLSFMDYASPLSDLLYKNVTPDAAARLEKLMGSDETALYFLPCYNFRLLADFADTTAVIPEKTERDFAQAMLAYEEILRRFCMRVLVSYADCYNKEFDEIMAVYKDVLTVEENYLALLEAAENKSTAEMHSATERLLVSGLVEKLSAADDEEMKFFFNLNVSTYFSRQFPDICKMMRPYYAKVQEIRKSFPALE